MFATIQYISIQSDITIISYVFQHSKTYVLFDMITVYMYPYAQYNTEMKVRLFAIGYI